MNDLVTKILAGIADPVGAPALIPAIQSGYSATPGTTLITGVSLNYGAASTLTVHSVADEIDLLMMAQCKTGTTIATGTHVGRNANFSTTTAGSTTTKQSGLAVDGATINTTSSLDLRIRAVSAIVPNAEGANSILEVTINKHTYGNATTAV